MIRGFLGRHRLDLGLVFVVLVWGASPTVFKFALSEVAPLTFVIMRFALLSVVAVVALLIHARRHPAIRPFRVRREDILPLIVSGLSGYGIYQLFYIEGLSRTTAFASALFGATVPLWSAFILSALHIERIRPVQWAGIVISLVGVAWFLLASPKTGGEAPLDRALTPAGMVLGGLLSFIGAGLFSLYGVVNKRLATRYSPPELMCYTLLVGAITLAPFGISSLATQDWSRVTWQYWIILPYSVFFPIYITYSLWNWAIAKRGVGYVTLYNYAVPVAGGIVAFFAIHEQITVGQGIAALVVLGGLLLARWAISHQRGEPAPAAQQSSGQIGELATERAD